MKRGFPFTPKPPQMQPVEVKIEISQPNLQNIMAISQATSLSPTDVANSLIAIGTARVNAVRFESGLVERIPPPFGAIAATPPPEEKQPQEQDTMTAEERLAENRRLAGL